MSDADENDVLKRLRDVRKRLQESIDDGGKVVEAQEKPLVAPSSGSSTSSTPESTAQGDVKKGPKLYKTKTDDVKKFSDKKFKETTGGVSRKRMAAIQRRIKTKAESRKRMSVGKKIFLMVALMCFAMPYFIMDTLALATSRFDFDNFGIRYGGPGQIFVTLPVTNPSFIPSELGELKIEIYNAQNEKIGLAYTDEPKTIQPYQTLVIELGVALETGPAGKFIESLLTPDGAVISLKNVRYNGMLLLKSYELPPISLYGMISDLTSGLNLGEMLGGIMLKPTASNVIDIWSMASQSSEIKLENGIPQPSQLMEIDCDDFSFGLLDLGIEETSKNFTVRADLAFKVPTIDRFDLGPIKIREFQTSIYGPSVENSTNPDDYKSEIARLATYSENLYDEPVCSVERDTDFPVEVNFGGISFAAAKFTLFKDNITGNMHPSADPNLNFDNATMMAAFEAANRHKLPTWYFFQNLLANQMLDVVIGIEKLSLEIFEIPVNIELPPDIARLQARTTERIFDIDELLGSLGNKPLTLATGISYITQTIATAGLGAPRPSQPSFDISAFDNLEVDINTDDLLSSLVETDDSISTALGIGLDNTFLDIHLGVKNVTLAIANEIDGVTRGFVLAKLGSPSGDFVYINGIGSKIEVNLNLTIFKNNETTPHVAKFLREILEEFKIGGKAIAGIGFLVLFAENYTFKGIKISLDLGSLLGSLDLSELLSDAIKGAIEGLVDDLAPSTESTTNGLSNLSFNNPLTLPVEFLTMLAFGSPLMSPYTGVEIPNAYLMTADGEKITTPQAAEDLLLEINEVGSTVKIFVVYPGLEIGEGSIPVHLGVGPAVIKIQSNSSNNYGLWDTLISLKLENYISLGPEASSLDIIASIEINGGKGSTLCKLLDSIFVRSSEPSFDLKIDAVLNLNISGVFLDNVHLALEVPKITMHLGLQSLIDSLLAPSKEDSSVSIPTVGPMKSIYEETTILWDGNYNSIPFASQDFDIGQYFSAGDFSITSIKETGWPDLNGTITVDLGIELYNGFMTIALVDPTIQIFSGNGLKMIEVEILGEARLTHKKYSKLNLRLTIYKSQDLQDFIANLLWDGSISGSIYLSLGIELFGCTIGPVSLNATISDLLGTFGVDLAELFMAMIPLNERTLRDSPKASQFDIDLLGDFGIAYVTTRDPEFFGETSQPPIGLINVGPQDFDDPMLTFHAGLALRPNFNMSIALDLNLCDKGIYTKILNSPVGTVEDALKYSKVASVSTTPGVIYSNNTYTPNANFSALQSLYPGINPVNYKYFVDPFKPYYNTTSGNNTGIKGLYYQQEYNGSSPLYRAYGTGKKDNVQGTFAMADIALSLYNISYGDWATRYPKQYWRALGGPYFPPQVFGPDAGGYPNHRITYHPNYAPLANILSGVDAVMSGDIGALLGNVQIVGSVRLNIFSLDIVVDTSSPLVESLVSSLLVESLDYLYDGYRDMLNPWRDSQEPSVAYSNRLNRISKYDDPSIPRFATMPFSSEFSTSLMKLDMESIIDDYPLLGMVQRNDHCYSPGIGGETYNGSYSKIEDTRYMGTNVCPWNDPAVPIDLSNPNQPKFAIAPTYKQGLKRYPSDTSHSNREVFVKDIYFEQYKLVVQQWADNYQQFNPFFESENFSTVVFATAANNYKFSYEKLEDSYDWALRWQNDKMRRTPSLTAIFSAAVIPAFDLGLLSAYANVWGEDPTPRPGGGINLSPLGYAWVNQSIYPKTVAERGGDPNFWKTSPVYGDNGEVLQDSNWAMLNLRLFESTTSRQFLDDLIGDINNINFNIYLDLVVNASLFGYELYNLAIGGLGTGSPGDFAKYTSSNLINAESGQVWGQFNSNGTITPPKGIKETFEWLPKEFLPQFDESSNVLPVDLGSILDLDKLLGQITGDIGGLIGTLLENIMSGIVLKLDLEINTPLYLLLWLAYLEGVVVTNNDQDAFYPDEGRYPNPLSWRPLVDLKKTVGTENTGALWTQDDAYYDYSVPGGKNQDPYNFAGNCLNMWPENPDDIATDYWKQYANQTGVQYEETIRLPPLTIFLSWADIGYVLDLVDELDLLTLAVQAIGGNLNGYLLSILPPYLWLTLLQNRYEMYKLTDSVIGQPGVPNERTVPNGAAIHALLPALGYDLPIILPYDLLFMNLMKLLRQALGEPDTYYDGENYIARMPKNFNGTAGNKQVTLTWGVPTITNYVHEYGLFGNTNYNLKGYRIYRSTNMYATFNLIAETSSLTYVDTTVQNDNTYYYRICAVYGDNTWAENGELSRTMSFRPKI